MIDSFNIAAIPNLHFGAGKIDMLSGVLKNYGSSILIVTGSGSFMASEKNIALLQKLNDGGIKVYSFSIPVEPSPQIIDTAVLKFSDQKIDAVVAIGGGSVLDAGKAISAMLPLKEPVKDYLEGVGTKNHPGKKIPYVAVPTTAGTGSEATKNAVLSEVGIHGYKKSLRHNNFVPDVAIVDPALMVSCPQAITASSGMDAFTQLLESYVSTAANPFTDPLALEGLKRVSKSLLKAFEDGYDLEARTDVALAAYLSGITLANAGLGLVHGFASSLGGYFEIPHGVVCSTLMPAANTLTVKQLRLSAIGEPALKKYATVGKIFSGLENKTADYYIDHLLELISTWTEKMSIPGLEKFGVTKNDFEKITAASDNKNNPVKLSNELMIEVLERSF